MDEAVDSTEATVSAPRKRMTPGGAATITGAAVVICLVLAFTTATGTVPRRVRTYGADTIGTEGQRNSAQTLVTSLNSQAALWKLQHNDRLPDFITYPGWQQFSQYTDAAGRPSAQRNASQLFGPYVQPAPVNPINGLGTVVSVDEPVKPGDLLPFGQRAGFVFSTATNHFWVTDAPGTRVINAGARTSPKRAGSRGGSPNSGLDDQVQSLVETVRSQVELYKLQHADTPPDFVTYPTWAQFTERTDERGVIDRAGKFGPYFRVAPVNPANGGTNVQVVRTPPGPGFACTTPGVGYVYDASTGRIYALDPQGRPYPW